MLPTAKDATSVRGWSARRAAIGLLLVCGGYYVGGIIALTIRFEPGGISAIWIPHGVLLAALVLIPPSRWWLYAAFLLPVHLHLVSTFQGPVPLSIMLIQYGGNIAQAALGAAVLRPIVSSHGLNVVPGMTALIVVGTMLAPLVVSAPVAWLFTVTGWVDDFWLAWPRRAFTAACGAVIVAPAILDLATGGLLAARRAPPRRSFEYLTLTAALVSVLLGLLAWRDVRPAHFWLPFAPMPLLLWSGVRFGPGGLGPHLLASALVALVKARAGVGPFGGAPGPDNLLALQGTLLVISVPMMLFSTLVQQHARAARALHEGEARYRSVVEDQTELICRHLHDGTFTFVNGAYCRYFQRSAEELIGNSFWQFIPVDQHAASRAFLESITPDRPVASMEHPVFGPGGEVRWQHWTDRGFFDEHGRIVEYQSVGYDITDRKRAEEAASDSEKQIRLFIQQAPAAMAMFDKDMRYLSYSQRWLTDYRLGEQNLVGRSHYEVFPEVSEEWKEIHRRCLEGAVDTCEEAPFIRHDGSLDWIRWEVRPWHNLQHEIGGIVMLTEVITDRKRAQDEHRQLAAQTRVAEALRDVDRRKDEFLAMLAHELRNPLAPIRLSVEALRRQPLSNESAEARDVIERQLFQLTRLVDDLLDISRITLGKINLTFETVDIVRVAEEAAEGMRFVIDARGHHLAISLPEEPLHVRGDSARLAQIISNLLDNAAKYTEPGGRISLALNRDGEDALVVVRDTGKGISPDQLPRIFDPFTQLSPTGEEGGLGIGLTLVQRLVEMHGGRVAARSAGVGAGSEFSVRIPAVENSSPVDTSAPVKSTRKPLIETRLRILVVDDNVDAATALTRLLRTSGHELRVAHDGRAALDAAADFAFDVALLDLALPHVNGLEVARQLRLRYSERPMLLIALTGFGQVADRTRTAQAGFDHHFTKPVGVDELEEVMSAWGIANGAT